MANISEKIYFKGGYTDGVMTVPSFSDLVSMGSDQRFNGLTVTVTNIFGGSGTGIPADFWFVNGSNRFSLQLKSISPLDTREQLEQLQSICVVSSSTRSQCVIPIGFEAALKSGIHYIFTQSGATAVWKESEAPDVSIFALKTDVSALSADVESNFAKKDVVDTLVGPDPNKSVRKIAEEELARQLIPEEAQEAFDTLEEIAAWIQQHPDDAAAMNAQIVTLSGDVNTLSEEISELENYLYWETDEENE